MSDTTSDTSVDVDNWTTDEVYDVTLSWLESYERIPDLNSNTFKKMKENIGKECFIVVNNCLEKGKVTSVEKLKRYFVEVKGVTEIRQEVHLLNDHKETADFLKITERRKKEKEETKQRETQNEITKKRQREE